ncbi:MAG: 2-hydroxy-6-oxo-6-phenylhexa-2,4-dienoate hydrolase [Anaerolineales bacterium]|nr:2-hydroxy-6-oxo-6-phenylhexa-2,4-dienoate hydrolase [Anaerolineales bacterium]
MSFPYRDETEELNDETRKRAENGAFAQLPNGVTHYELSGNESAEAVVLVHGFSVPYFIYDPTFEFLARSGFRVLRYDLFGRGFSDRPRARYNLDFFVRQLAELLEALRLTRRVNLVSLSMGGPIASAFALRYPERIRKLVLIDPAGAKPIDTTLAIRLARVPILAELAYNLLGGKNLVNGIADDFFNPALVEQFQARYKIQMQYKGFIRAILSTIREKMLGTHSELYRALGKTDHPILLLWGRNDKTVPFEQSALLREALPNAEFHVIEDCGHIPHYEKPDEVNPILLNFLRQS